MRRNTVFSGSSPSYHPAFAMAQPSWPSHISSSSRRHRGAHAGGGVLRRPADFGTWNSTFYFLRNSPPAKLLTKWVPIRVPHHQAEHTLYH